MAQPLAGAVRDAAQLVPEFSMSGAAGGRPFALAPEVAEPCDAKPVANVRMWDENTLWLKARHADRRTLLGDSRTAFMLSASSPVISEVLEVPYSDGGFLHFGCDRAPDRNAVPEFDHGGTGHGVRGLPVAWSRARDR
ncbi:hypothetical protein ACFXC8_49900 [Streptomyces sp. NPDC059441]|uniref:hypothetical protein n=1 Tax=Streptomyces sp. NPDC059441 TaxID=3346829 RepID=UPI0036B79511